MARWPAVLLLDAGGPSLRPSFGFHRRAEARKVFGISRELFRPVRVGHASWCGKRLPEFAGRRRSCLRDALIRVRGRRTGVAASESDQRPAPGQALPGQKRPGMASGPGAAASWPGPGTPTGASELAAAEPGKLLHCQRRAGWCNSRPAPSCAGEIESSAKEALAAPASARAESRSVEWW
jgi:hypothetical protein